MTNAEATDEVEPTAEDWRIAELGLDIAEIARQMFNVTSANGRRYQKKSRDVQALASSQAVVRESAGSAMLSWTRPRRDRLCLLV